MVYTVRYRFEYDRFAEIDADSPEDALEIAKDLDISETHRRRDEEDDDYVHISVCDNKNETILAEWSM